MLLRNSLKIGSRRSKLALWQAEFIKSELEKLYHRLEIEIVKIVTSGDKILDVPLARIGGKGLFVKEIEAALSRGEIDIAVHSMKDVPTELPEDLEIAVITEREKPFDALISNSGKGLASLPIGAVVGTSSLRRRAQLLNHRSDLQIVDLRGNLDTRMRKLETEGMEAIIVAAAGVIRLGHENMLTEILPPEIFIPAVGQGSLGIEVRKSDSDVKSMIAPLKHDDSFDAITAERALLRKLEGGCQIPIGAYGQTDNGQLKLMGIVASLDGGEMVRGEVCGVASDAANLGIQLADQLFHSGGKEILEEIRKEEIRFA